MNVYDITSPKDGEIEQDDILGAVRYNATDGTWEKLLLGEAPTNWNTYTTSSSSPSKGSGWVTVILVLLILGFVYWMLFKR